MFQKGDYMHFIVITNRCPFLPKLVFLLLLAHSGFEHYNGGSLPDDGPIYLVTAGCSAADGNELQSVVYC